MTLVLFHPTTQTFNISCQDGINSGDGLTRPQLNLLGMVYDTGLIAGFSSVIGSFNVSVPAGLDLAENVFGSLLLDLATADQVTLSDLSAGIRNYFRTSQDGTKLSDSSSSIIAFVGSAIEQIILAAAPSGPMISYLTVPETTTISELIQGSALFPRSTADALSASDSPSGIRVFFRTIQDTLDLADANTSQVVFAPTAIDGVIAGVAINAPMIIHVPVVDPVVLAELLSGACIFATQLTDGMELGSSSAGPITILVSVSDGTTISQVIDPICNFIVSLQEHMTISDIFMRWDPDGIVFLSFTASGRVFNLVASNKAFSRQAEHQHSSFTAKPGRST